MVSIKEVKKDKLLKIIEEKNIEGDDIMPTLAREWFDEGKQVGLMEGREEGRQEGINLGIERGMQRGMEQGKNEFILNMFGQGLEIDDISKFTGLSKAEVEEILKNNEN
jgi:predicted transposase/invertase (TIGR01784 family)